MTIYLPRDSVEVVQQEIISDVDPTGETPDVMIHDVGEPTASGTWVAATWADVDDDQPRYVVVALAGTGSLDFGGEDEDTYPLHKQLYVRVNNGVESAIVPGEFVEVV